MKRRYDAQRDSSAEERFRKSGMESLLIVGIIIGLILIPLLICIGAALANGGKFN
jgi:isochorismate hydrolase